MNRRALDRGAISLVELLVGLSLSMVLIGTLWTLLVMLGRHDVRVESRLESVEGVTWWLCRAHEQLWLCRRAVPDGPNGRVRLEVDGGGDDVVDRLVPTRARAIDSLADTGSATARRRPVTLELRPGGPGAGVAVVTLVPIAPGTKRSRRVSLALRLVGYEQLDSGLADVWGPSPGASGSVSGAPSNVPPPRHRP